MLREEEAENLSAQGKHYLDTIMNSARFAGVLVDSLLDFSRFGRTQIERIPVAMERLVDEEWEAMLHVEGRGRQIDFKRGRLPRVNGDPHLLRLVIRNLLSNAVKYTGKREQAVIRLDATTEGHEIIFVIKDNGVGFDPQYAAKLFGVFQRLHRVEEFEGTGIGLANVRRIVGRHGGRTWAEAVPGEGATFFFSMPAGPSQRGD
jgi:light-regulated signal transduction histidine kinase (bacteriophytochrome)